MIQTVSDTGISVIIPVHNGGEKFRQCLAAVMAASPPAKEIIVVADGPSDEAWRAAESTGCQIIELPQSGGPARARNVGAEAASGDILLFVDADVTVRPDTLACVRSAFDDMPEVDAIFGSYDDQPVETNFFSQFKNLFHHYVHQNSNRQATTFWAGCGAVRREVFLAVGGFDASYRKPSIEDIELGYRLSRAGHPIRLVKHLQVTHLKRWQFASMLKADIFCRALPWTELILKRGGFDNDLNIRVAHRLSVVGVYILVPLMLAAGAYPSLLLPAAILSAGLLWLNRDLYRFFNAKRGIRFAAGSVLVHWLYYLYSGAAFWVGMLGYWRTKLGQVATRDRTC